MTCARPVLALVIIVLALGGARAADEGAPSPYDAIELGFPPGTLKVVSADLDGDGLRDLIGVAAGRFTARVQNPADSARGLSGGGLTLEVAADAAWCVADARPGGGKEICVWLAPGQVRAWSVVRAPDGAPRFDDGAILAADLPATPPRGFRSSPFIQDVNGDGRGDLLLPDAGVVHVYLSGDDGTLRPSAHVAVPAARSLALDGEGELRREIGQRVAIPHAELRDVNGDGHRDLIARGEERYEVYLAGAGGDYPPSPSYSIDLERSKEPDPREYHANMDPGDLLRGALPRTEVLSGDVNGDGREDVLVRRGEKLSLYLAVEGGLALDVPAQILRASGNILNTQLVDENEDGRRDLILIRIGAISIGDVLLWLLFPGKLEVMALVYHNEEGRFTRKPDREIHISVSFPSIVSLMRMFRESSDGDPADAAPIAVARGDLTGAGASDDGLLLDAQGLHAYLGRAGGDGFNDEAEPFARMVAFLGYRRDLDEYTVDIEELMRFPSPDETLIAALEGAAPDFALAAPESALKSSARPVLYLLDMDGDRRDEVLLLYRDADDAIQGALYRSR